METVNVRHEGEICIVEMNRPEVLNAFNVQLMDDLCDAFLAATRDAGVKVLILTGVGRAFSAGADLMEIGRANHRAKHGLSGLLEAVIDFPKPFIVAVNGVGAGIGATICGLADLVYLSETARLRCPFSSLGLSPEAASTYTFPALMGRQRATWFLLSSEWMSAADCVKAGLALEAVPQDVLMPHATAKAQTLSALPMASLVETKALMMEPLKQAMKDRVSAENQTLTQLLSGAACQEALKAFTERREPDFGAL